ncbi:UPF0182 protein [Clostridia bacterium]|nr:UPF0182 protein [Clostridia bacterium]
MKKIPAKRLAVTAAVVGVVALALITLHFYAQYIGIKEIGASCAEVFWRNFNVNAITFGIAFLLFFTMALLNLQITRGNLTPLDSSFGYLKRQSPLVIISAALGCIFANYARMRISDAFLPFLTSEWFNLGDPIFHQDVGYYVFQRPFYVAVTSVLTAFGGFLIAFTALTYVGLYARYDFYNLKRLLRVRGILMHQIAVIVFLFLIKAVSYKFEAENVLFEASKELTGGGYIDINVVMRFYRFLPILMVLLAAGSMVFAFNSRYMHAFMIVLFYPIALAVVALVANTMQTLVVAPDEFAAERDFIQYNIDFTRAAYGLDDILRRDFVAEGDINSQAVMANVNTINNIKLTDADQVLKTANQIQALRPYYRFTGADIVPYTIDGAVTGVWISAREIAAGRSGGDYISERMRYTHGNGVVMSPVGSVTEQGQPYFTLRDIPPRAQSGAPPVHEPRIYYGENTSDYAVVGARGGEFDETDSDYRYNGNTGIRLTLLNRVLYAFRYGDPQLLYADRINADSRLLTNRQVLRRVRAAAPFLTFDGDIYMLIDGEGRLKWVADGYTTSKWFPYAQYSGDINYIRASVKAVVDAYDGTVKLYITDGADPIVKSYHRIYPTLFEDQPIPATLAEHFRYPIGIFKTQSEILKRYHVENAQEFHEKQRVWAATREKQSGDKYQPSEPHYGVIKLPGEQREELVLTQAYTTAGSDAVVAFAAARSAPGHEGQVMLYRFANPEGVRGTYAVEGMIDGDATLTADVAAWVKGGGIVVRGAILTVPIRGSLLYVEPIYVSAGSDPDQLPELRRVALVYGEKVVVKPTLDEGLKAMFGASRPTVVTTNEETLEDVISRVLQSFDEMKGFSRETDWENYGKSLRELDDNMGALRERYRELSVPEGEGE